MTDSPRARTEWQPARLTAVRSAGCLDHAIVVLETEADGEIIPIRVDEISGRALLGELAGLPSTTAVAADILHAIIRAAGAHISRVQVAPEGDRSGRILFSAGERSAGIESVPAGPLLVLATQLAIPVEVSMRTVGPSPDGTPPLPEPFQRLINELRLGSVHDE